MPIGVSEVIAFFVGGVLFRYFEEIRDFIFKIRDDIERLRNG